MCRISQPLYPNSNIFSTNNPNPNRFIEKIHPGSKNWIGLGWDHDPSVWIWMMDSMSTVVFRSLSHQRRDRGRNRLCDSRCFWRPAFVGRCRRPLLDNSSIPCSSPLGFPGKQVASPNIHRSTLPAHWFWSVPAHANTVNEFCIYLFGGLLSGLKRRIHLRLSDLHVHVYNHEADVVLADKLLEIRTQHWIEIETIFLVFSTGHDQIQSHHIHVKRLDWWIETCQLLKAQKTIFKCFPIRSFEVKGSFTLICK